MVKEIIIERDVADAEGITGTALQVMRPTASVKREEDTNDDNNESSKNSTGGDNEAAAASLAVAAGYCNSYPKKKSLRERLANKYVLERVQ